MIIKPRHMNGLWEINFEPHVDFRGFLVRSYDSKTFDSSVIDRRWIQESWSHTNVKGTVRGLHVQLPPYTETKLITILRGAMKWVVVDLREGSDTFGQWDAVTLSAKTCRGLFVEAGFAHGCFSLSDESDLVIKSDHEFQENAGVGILWSDPVLGIDWGLNDTSPIISERDSMYSDYNNFLDKYGSIRCATSTVGGKE